MNSPAHPSLPLPAPDDAMLHVSSGASHNPTHHATHHPDTALVHAGRTPHAHGGFVNTPVYRGSTILSPSFEAWAAAKRPGHPTGAYGRFGNPTTRAFEGAVAGLEGGHRAQVFPSGLSACSHALMAFLKAGDHLLIVDSVYGPTRHFVEQVLGRCGIVAEFFDPLIGAGLAARMRPTTRVVYVESPGSLGFEMIDVPLLADIAHTGGATVILDNSWASPLFFKPFVHGVDVSIQAATKYLVGHSDALLGVVTTTREAWAPLEATAHAFGETAGPDDVYLALRGLRTLGVRLRQHEATGIALAESLVGHPAVEAVLHPALAGHPGHSIWRRDFLGASGLFAVALKPLDRAVLAAVIDELRLFGLGLSWGGFESLVLPVIEPPRRSSSAWPHRGPLLRLHAGLEHGGDLIKDLHRALHHAVPA